MLICGAHRMQFDLKSANILCARDWTAKIADVGLAKFMTSEHFTQITTMGTLAWAAPELLRYACAYLPELIVFMLYIP